MFKVSIVQDHNHIEERTHTNPKTGEIKTYYSQYGYITLPNNIYPQKMKVPVESPMKAYPVGDYTLSPMSVQIGRFDSLEINVFNIKLDRVQK